MFDIFCVGDNPVKEILPGVKQIASETDVRTLTKMYWVIEPNVKITDLSVFDFRPSDYEDIYEHVWKWNDNNYGGVKLKPRKTSQGIKEHDEVVCVKSFDVINKSDPTEYFEAHPYATHVWVADPEYILPDSITWAPDNFEPDYIHSFHVPGQLEHKYPDQEGGIKLYPKLWNNASTKYHGYLDVTIKFPVIRTSTPNVYDVDTDHNYVWLVDHELNIDDSELQWVPSVFEREMVHNFHIPGQLEFKYPEAQGPVSLVPVGVSKPDIVYHGEISVRYQVLKVSDPTDFTQRDHITDEFVWLVDSNYHIDKGVLDFIPNLYDRSRVHNFHLSHQLEHLYPEEMGGVYLVPRNWQDAELKIMGVIDGVRYPVVYTDYPEAYKQREYYDSEYVWLVDKNYRINPDSLTWTPSMFDDDQIHNFRMPNQLTEKYPQDMGGIYLVPRDYKNAELKIHKTCPIEDEIYDVFRVDHSELTQEKFSELSKVSKTQWFWVMDNDYDFNGKLRYVPAEHELEYIHAFKWGMPERYSPEITELWDNRVAGIYLVPVKHDWQNKKLHTDKTPIEYDVFYTDDVNSVKNFSKYSNQSRTDAFWLVDSEHRLPDRINWVPRRSEQSYINIFKIPGQLEHKYPKAITNTSDNRCGGVKLVPKNFNINDVKFQGNLNKIEYTEFGKFSSVEEGLRESTTEWFWVIDPDVDPVEDFDWDFIPDTWDTGKTHVWQVANPVTGLNYDYGGIKLHHKQPTGGRDKYIKQTGSVRKPLDVLYLAPPSDIVEQLNNYESSTYMYYAVDPNVKVSPDFDFGVYPTQWDQDCVHLFKNSDGTFKNIRLVPRGYQFKSLDQITNNSYDKLKEHDIVASINREWPVYYLKSLDAKEFHKLRKSTPEQWFFTVDPGTDPLTTTWDHEPDVNDFDRVHTWQRINPHTDQVHGYGGVRLWPTEYTENITTDALVYNRIPRLRYIRKPRSQFKPYPVVLLSYHEERAQTAFDVLSKLNIHGGPKWVKNVKGIFEAHKKAAQIAHDQNAKMFWVVDADADLKPDFDFSYIPDVYDQDTVHVWTTENPVTGGKYGYGGVKLFNTQQVMDAQSWGLDFTTGLSNRFKVMPEVCATTLFNTSAYDAWRSAFREVVKLSVNNDPDSEYRIKEWLYPPFEDVPFSAEVKLGAQEAVKYANENSNDLEKLDNINNYEWLKKKFSQR